jgi:quinol monooxygenase YgiN
MKEKQPVHILEIIPSIMRRLLTGDSGIAARFLTGKEKLLYLHEQIRRRGIGRGSKDRQQEDILIWVTMVHYKLKSGVTHDEAIQHFRKVMVPVYREFPGCLGVKLFQYTWSWGEEQPKWDYVFVEEWESNEALDQAKEDGLVERQSEAGVWAFGKKTEGFWAGGGNLVASS